MSTFRLRAIHRPKSSSMSFNGISRVRPPPSVPCLDSVLIDNIRQPFARQCFRRIGDLEVQMRLARISRSPDQRDDLSAPHTLTDLDAHTARLQVTVIGELTGSEIQCDRIAGNGVQRDRQGKMKILVVPRHIVRKPVSCRHDGGIRHRDHGLTTDRAYYLVSDASPGSASKFRLRFYLTTDSPAFPARPVDSALPAPPPKFSRGRYAAP